MRKKLYVAYGSNLNFHQMKYRCPGAKLCATGVIDGYELQFKGQPYGAFATIAPKAGASVPVAVWEISRQNELALDRYEGYPSHYFKEEVSVQLGGREVTAMVYLMNRKMDFGLPSPYYYATVQEGYRDCGLNVSILQKALRASAAHFYQAQSGQNLQSLFDVEDGNAAEDGEALAETTPERDETAPLCCSEGMRL